MGDALFPLNSERQIIRDSVCERIALSQKIGEFQGISFNIPDMKTRIETAHLFLYNVAMAEERSETTGEHITLQSSVAKLFASVTAIFYAHAAVQIYGGLDYSKELPFERNFRDPKITEIYEGASEIQRLVISRTELGLN